MRAVTSIVGHLADASPRLAVPGDRCRRCSPPGLEWPCRDRRCPGALRRRRAGGDRPPWAIEASDDLATFLKWFSGEEFPATNEDRLREVARAYRAAADGLDELLPIFGAAVNSIRDGVQGQAEQAFVAAMQGYVGESGYLTLAGKYLRRLGLELKEIATQVEYTKLMIIAAVVELMIEFTVAAAIAWFFPGTLQALAMRLLVGRLRIALWLARLLSAVATSQVVGVGMQVLKDVIVQAVQLRDGTRARWDPKLTADAAAVGAWGGGRSVARSRRRGRRRPAPSGT